MKTLFKTTTAIVLLAVSLISYGTNDKGRHYVTVKNNSGKTVYTQTFNVIDSIVHSNKLTELEDGLYSLEITRDFEIITKRFAVTNHKVTFLENTEEKSFVPVFRIDGNRIYISQLTLDPKQELDIKIYYENELIKRETIKGSKILDRIYHLKEDLSGQYTVIMKNEGNIYKESFKI